MTVNIDNRNNHGLLGSKRPQSQFNAAEQGLDVLALVIGAMAGSLLWDVMVRGCGFLEILRDHQYSKTGTEYHRIVMSCHDICCLPWLVKGISVLPRYTCQKLWWLSTPNFILQD
jgi:hypothetical protein